MTGALAAGLLVAISLSQPGFAQSSAPEGRTVVTPAGEPARAAKAGKGKLLVASRRLADANFAEAVVLLLEYGPGGAMGLILNRESGLDLSDVLPSLDKLAGRKDPLYVGGPVEPARLLILLRAAQAPERSVQVFDDVYVTSSAQTLLAAIEKGESAERLRAYSGYAGWGPGQLEAEIGRSDWYIVPADVPTVFSTVPRDIWADLVERISGQWVGLNLQSGG